MTWMILISALLFNGLEAVIEAIFNHLDNNSPNKVHRFIEKYHAGVVIFVFILWAVTVYIFIPNDIPYLKLFFGYGFVRFLTYDTIWNVASILLGEDIYIWGYGKDKWYDRTMVKLASFGWCLKGVSGIIGIAFLLDIQGYIDRLG